MDILFFRLSCPLEKDCPRDDDDDDDDHDHDDDDHDHDQVLANVLEMLSVLGPSGMIPGDGPRGPKRAHPPTHR